jgi:hypothetical protein
MRLEKRKVFILYHTIYYIIIPFHAPVGEIRWESITGIDKREVVWSWSFRQ